MNSPNFASILDEAPTEIERPKPVPPGTYIGVVQGTPVYDKSAKKGTDYVQFTIKPIAAEDDVDAEDLAEMGGFENKTFKLNFYLTEDAAYRLDEFHEHCGLDISTPMSRRHRNDEVVNAQIRFTIKHRLAPDGSQTYAEIGRTLKAD